MIALPVLSDRGISIGDAEDCRVEGGLKRRHGAVPGSVLHACKYPCHADATGLPPLGDPRYLACRVSDAHLTLNMIDPPTPLFSVELFTRALDFLDERLAVGPVLIHCNQGLSRAPSIALAYLAKRTPVLGSDRGYEQARAGMALLYPAYAPGTGLVEFLTAHWTEIG